MNRSEAIGIVSRLSLGLLKGTLTERKPFILSHLICARCNYVCPHCLWRDAKTPELTVDEIRSLYRQARREGFVMNYVWGGEPLVRRDVPEILEASKQNGLLTLINTNAWFLKDKLDSVAPFLDMVIVSLNGSSAAVHDATTGVKGSFDRTLESVRALKSRYPRIPVIFNSLIFESNRHDIDGILAVWKQMDMHGYFNFIEIDLRTSAGMGTRNVPLDITEEGRRETAELLMRRKKESSLILNTNSYFTHFIEGRRAYRCHFPKMFLEVYSDGSVLDCVNVDRPIGNVRTEPLSAILRHPRIQGMIDDGEHWCDVHNNADRIDASNMWELRPESLKTGARFLVEHNLKRFRKPRGPS